MAEHEREQSEPRKSEPDATQRPLEQWPEDEGSAPHARPEFPSILRLLLRATPRVTLAIVLAFLYTASEGQTALAFLLSWIVVVGSMVFPGWRRYVETGKRHKPAPAEPVISKDGVPLSASPAGARVAAARETAAREAAAKEVAGREAARQAAAREAARREGVDDEVLDPRDRWELPDELAGGPVEPVDPPREPPAGPAKPDGA